MRSFRDNRREGRGGEELKKGTKRPVCPICNMLMGCSEKGTIVIIAGDKEYPARKGAFRDKFLKPLGNQKIPGLYLNAHTPTFDLKQFASRATQKQANLFRKVFSRDLHHYVLGADERGRN